MSKEKIRESFKNLIDSVENKDDLISMLELLSDDSDENIEADLDIRELENMFEE